MMGSYMSRMRSSTKARQLGDSEQPTKKTAKNVASSSPPYRGDVSLVEAVEGVEEASGNSGSYRNAGAGAGAGGR